MEESSDANMETDVSSTTADVQDMQEVTGSNEEVVIVIEKLDEEVPVIVVPNELDSELSSQTNDEITDNIYDVQSVNKSPQKDLNLQMHSNTSNKVGQICESESEFEVSSNKEPVEIPIKSLQIDVQMQNVIKKTSPIKVVQVHGLIQKSPSKLEQPTVVKTVIPVVKTPVKNLPTIKIQAAKAVTSTSNIENQKTQNNNDENTVQEVPTNSVDITKTVTSNIQTTPVKTVEILKTVTKSPSKETSNEQTIQIKSVEILKTLTKSPSKETLPQEPMETTTKEFEEGEKSEETKPEENITNNIKPQENLVVSSADMISDVSNELYSESNVDISEKEHNKSISRELKSLINSAKESKIISECTQLTSKTRKSRVIANHSLEASNTSFNTSVESGKIQVSRRSSNNSQRSNSSEVSEKATLKRSMRSQNPEFVNKVKQFLNSVTGRGQKNDDLSDEEIDNNDHNKSKESLKDSSSSLPKKKRKSYELPLNKKKLRSDPYCWRCHWAIEVNPQDPRIHSPVRCTVCPRAYHYKCLSAAERNKLADNKSWVCPECMIILNAESSETRSSTMKNISLGMLCELLKHALERMMELNGVEPFLQPVDRSSFPDYDNYIVHPMDLSMMKDNIDTGVYGSTEAFLADAQWIMHNSVIFNTHLYGACAVQSKLTGVARTLLRTCRAQIGEIEACPECYAAAYARRPTWFTDVCSTPHILLWAKLKGFPYWPAKGMSVNSSGMVDVRFFGAHDRAWVPMKDCYLFSEKDPNNFRTKRQDILDSMEEAEQHIRNISRKYGSFVYPSYKVQFDGSKWNEQLKMMIPSFVGEVTMSLMKDKSVFSSPNSSKSKSRSNSKASKDSNNDCDMSDNDNNSVAPSHKMANGVKSLKVEKSNKNNAVKASTSQKEDTVMEEIDTPQYYKNQNFEINNFKKEIPRKRRRSELVEAVYTILVPSGTKEKRKRIECDQKHDNENFYIETTSAANENKSARSEKNIGEKTTDNYIEQTEPLSSSTPVAADKSKMASNHKAITPKINKQTPKTTKGKTTTTDKDDCKDTNTNINNNNNASRDITSNETDNINKMSKQKAKKRVNAGNNKSRNSAQITLDQSDYKVQSNNSTVDTTKENDKAAADKSTSDKNSTPKSRNVKRTKSPRGRLRCNDDTTLAEIARKVSKNNIVVNSIPGLPTISSVRSLSNVSAESTLSKDTSTDNIIEVTIDTNTDSSVFTPTSTDNVRNAKDASNKLQKLKNSATPSPTQIGRVGVRAFARMSSPPKKTQRDDVQVEIKKEPVDYDDERQKEKLNLMNVFKLRPVNPAAKTNLRNVRINRVIAGPPSATKNVTTPDIHPRARKTFPQPKKSEETSGLNSKNSMVYIPIQPPMTQAPVKVTRTNVNIAPVTSVLTTAVSTTKSSVVVADKLVTTTANNMVNIVTTPIMSTFNNSSSSLPIMSTLPAVPTNVHTVPLITSVNGQWTFSLQPVMSVGGVNNAPSPPIVNGICERPTILPAAPSTTVAVTSSTVPPLLPTTSAKKSSNTATIDLTEPPRLQQKPSMTHPLDPTTPMGTVPVPSVAGPLTTKLNQNAVKLTDFFRNLLEDSLELIDDPTVQLTALKLQLEQTRWRHQQEIDEIKHNHELIINEMRGSFEKDKSRAVAQLRRAAQTELEAAVKSAKSKQWCVYCKKEAQFYCCWNTAYCDYPCQRAHWAVHHGVCTQKRNPDGSNDPATIETNSADSRLNSPIDNNMPVLQKSGEPAAGGDKSPAAQLYNESQSKSSYIVNMVEDSSGKQTMKCVGTYSAAPSLLNKQLLKREDNKKSSGGYLIVGASNSTITNARRAHTMQYYPS